VWSAVAVNHGRLRDDIKLRFSASEVPRMARKAHAKAQLLPPEEEEKTETRNEEE
jgi:hypothetical protein